MQSASIPDLDLRPRFMNLGSPRSSIPLPPPLPSPHFKFFKEHAIHPHGALGYAGWILLALVVGISVASFITESVLLLGDNLFPSSETRLALGNERNTHAAMATSTEARGSDDFSATTTPPTEYRLANADKFPKITAGSYLVGDIETGEIIYEYKPDLIAPLASVSKLMTAVIAKEEMDPDRFAIVSRDSYNTFGAEGELLLGEKIRVQDLMYPLLIESSNDGAEVLADEYGHDKFLLEMNKRTKILGMSDTYYEDPSGLSPKNVSSVEDQFKLARYIWNKDPTLWGIMRIRQYAILKHQWTNKNALLTYDYFLGGKNGFIDEAKKTTVSLFQIPMAKGGLRKIVIVLLKSDDRTNDALRILDFVRKNGYYSPTVNNAGLSSSAVDAMNAANAALDNEQ